MQAIKSRRTTDLKPGDILVADLPRSDGLGHGGDLPDHLGVEALDFGKEIAVITDARFSGVSTGACIGHVSPEALAGGPIGKLHEGDLIEITIDTRRLEGSIHLVGADGKLFGAEEGTRVLASRPMRSDLAPDPLLPDDTRLWAALQNVSGGTWGGCVFDVDAILKALGANTAT